MKISEELFANIVAQVSSQADLLNRMSDELNLAAPEMDNEESKPQIVATFADAVIPFGHPDSTQLALMNQHRPYGAEAYTSDEMVSIPLMASNNLLWHSHGVWSPNALIQLADLYAMDAPDQQLDHRWHDTQSTIGFIYDAQVIVSPDAPEYIYGRGSAVSGYIPDADSAAIDREIIERDGYHQLMVYSAVAANHPAVEAYRYRRLADVSVGCLTDGKFICPIDGTYFGAKSWMRCEHGHFLPHWIIMLFLDDDERDMVAPYYVRDRVEMAIELSDVTAGDAPAASTVRQLVAMD